MHALHKGSMKFLATNIIQSPTMQCTLFQSHSKVFKSIVSEDGWCEKLSIGSTRFTLFCFTSWEEAFIFSNRWEQKCKTEAP